MRVKMLSLAPAAITGITGTPGHMACTVCSMGPNTSGDKGDGGVGDRLVGGQGTLATSKPVRTVGSYWPYAPTLFDYIRRAMPQNAPESLSNDDVYAVSAYILHLNGLLPADATIDAETMGTIKMPNRNMFVGDSRPDVKNSDCMSRCGTPRH